MKEHESRGLGTISYEPLPDFTTQIKIRLEHPGHAEKYRVGQTIQVFGWGPEADNFNGRHFRIISVHSNGLIVCPADALATDGGTDEA